MHCRGCVASKFTRDTGEDATNASERERERRKDALLAAFSAVQLSPARRGLPAGTQRYKCSVRASTRSELSFVRSNRSRRARWKRVTWRVIARDAGEAIVPSARDAIAARDRS